MGTGPTSPTPPVFLCYRRTDSLGFASQLHAALDAVFGAGTVFRDEDDAPWGKPWGPALEAALANAKVVLVLIGPGWLRAADEFGRRRLDQTDDWVRREIESTLQAKRELVPILLEGATMPPAVALPDEIVGLAALQARGIDVREWGTATAAITVRLEELSLRRTAGVPLPATPPTPTDPLPALRRHLRTQHQNLITFPGIDVPPIHSVHVELEIAWTPMEGGDCEPGFGGRRPDGPRTLSPRALLELPPDPQSRTTGFWVVLGDPGAGKSTMLRHLAFTLADPAASPGGPIAVYVPLASWALAPNRSPFELVEDGLRTVAGDLAASGLAARLHALAGPQGEAGRVWLLLDGLDEVAPEHLANLQNRLATLQGHLPNARLLVTSREIGFRSLGEPFRVARLRPLDAGRQRQFLQRWLGKDKTDDLLARLETRPQLKALATNPLLLTMLVAVAKDPELPRTRVGLYQRAIEHLILKKHNREALRIDRPTEVRLVLQALGLSLQDSPAVAWTKPQLVGRLLGLTEGQPRLAKVLEAFGGCDEFLTQVAERTGLLAECDGPLAPWRFLHRQFRETLAAEALAAAAEAGGDWQGIVGSLDGKTISRWSETLGLLCGLLPTMPILERVRQADVDAVVKMLRDVDGAEPVVLLEFLLGTKVQIELAPKSWERQTHWDGDDLRLLVTGWHREQHPGLPEVMARLWSLVRDPKASTERLGWLHWGLSGAGPVDRRRFFTACGRPVEAAPKLAAVAVPAGTFVMGSPATEAERSDDEGPQHDVEVGAFWLCRTAVTNGDYRRFDPKHEGRESDAVKAAELPTQPVVNVSWWEAYLFCRWIGDDVRLPSEAEWECACRAGTTTPFSFGENITPEQVNYNGTFPYADGKRGLYRTRTVPVGSLPANAWGLHEMHGNVLEWCQDGWHDSYEGAPLEGTAWEASGSGDRVVRGGSWFDFARSCRSAYRSGGPPGDRYGRVGFRPASSSPDHFTTSPPDLRDQTRANRPK